MSDDIAAIKGQTTQKPHPAQGSPAIDRDSAGKPLVFKTVEDIRTKAPKVWNQMMLAFSQVICRESRKHINRLRQMRREPR